MPMHDSADHRRPLRAGLVGAGSMGRNHAGVIRSLGRSRLVAVADPDQESAELARGGRSEVQLFSRIYDMLRAADLDVLHVCSPPALHFEHAKRALEAGVHPYVEKPFADSRNEATELLELAAAKELLVCAGHQLKAMFPRASVEDWLARVGRVSHVESHFHFSPSDRKARSLRPDEQFMDVLPHPVYLLFHFLTEASTDGRPVSIRDVTVGPGATAHATVATDETTGTLHVTLEGRPVDSTIRIVGTGGTLTVDYVREAAYFVRDRGGSGVGKILTPLALSAQLARGSMTAGFAHVFGTRSSYPGLSTLISDFHDAVRLGGESPVPPDEIEHSMEVTDRVRSHWKRESSSGPGFHASDRPSVVVTGGTGFLGRPTVKTLREMGRTVRAVSRRGVAPWERVDGVEYVRHDLADSVPSSLFAGAEVVLHAAAATSGGWEEHRRGTIELTENVLRAASDAGVERFLHVSSMAVLEPAGESEPLSETSSLLAEPRRSGPYAWGKTEAERLARRLSPELSVDLKVVRPGPVVDEADFEPPGRLGRGLGSFFFAVGSEDETLGVVGREFASRILAFCCEEFDTVPSTLNLISPDQPTRGELVRTLKERRPWLHVVRLPWAVLKGVDPLALVAQRILGSSDGPGVSLSDVFRASEHDTSRISRVVRAADSPPAPTGRLTETLVS